MKAWDDFLTLLEQKFGKSTVNKWIRPLRILSFDAWNLYLEPQDSFQVIWFNEHVLPLAKKLFMNNNGHPIKIHFSLKDNSSENGPLPPNLIDVQFDPDPITPHATFEQYIPGEKNRSSFNIFAKILGFNPETGKAETFFQDSFNPLFIYGPQSIGKTHLLMAAQTFLKLKGLKAFYVKAETFTEHVVWAIRSSQMQKFRETYRNIDVLIVDDVEVFGRKMATQEEFFHTFNTLHTEGKQIILSAHVNPRLLEHIEDRLISRFEWGITLPFEKYVSTEMLLDVIKHRAEFYHIKIKKNLLDYLMKNFITPASMSRAIEYLSNHTRRDQSSMIELIHVEPILKRLMQQDQRALLTPEKILSLVAEVFGIKVEDLLSKSQSRDTSIPRQISMYLLRKELKMPYMKIGDIFHRDHSTVMSGIKQITKALEEQNSDILYYMNQLTAQFAKF